MDSQSRPRAPDGPVSYGLATVGLGLITAAIAIGGLIWAMGAASHEPGWSVVARFLLTFAGVCSLGAAVARWPADAFTLGLAALGSFLGVMGLPFTWDSIQLACSVLGVLALLGLIFQILPPTGRKILASLIIIFHFGGIVSAITAPTPQPWISGQMWTRVYRPYLQFLYLNNAYHFYSPEPGPASLLWFVYEFEREDDPTQRRYDIYETPSRPDQVYDPLGVSYYRRLSLAEQINQGQPPVLMIPVDVARRRSTAGQVIPLQQDMPETMQYRPPADLTKRLQIPSYVRHAATLRKPKPGERLVSIRMYRVEHSMISPSQFTALEMDPYDPDLYRPFFLGEFDEEGRLLNEKDPLLYWLVPIIRRELSPAEAALGQQKIPHWKFGNLRRGDVEYTDYSLLHATGKLHWDATTEQEGRDTNAKQEGGGR